MARRQAMWAGVFAALAVAMPLHAQPKPADATKPTASAVKLPDGTVVFLTKTPDDPNPLVDGVVLSAAEYQTLVEQAEEMKAQKLATKPVPPSAVAVRGAVEVRGERPVAALTAEYRFRTTRPKALVSLGGQRAAVVAARGADGKVPLLTAGDDGFVVQVETAGEHTLTLDLEVPVASRGAGGEIGFELGLPRAAISTLLLDKPPAGAPAMTVGSRGPELGAAVRRVKLSVESLAKAYPLGPTDTLELSWDSSGRSTAVRSAESEVSVRVDETRIETTSKVRLRGVGEWPLTLPAGADVSVEWVGSPRPTSAPAASLVSPTDPTGTGWVIRTPAEPAAGEWVATAVVRSPRPMPDAPTYRGPYQITGPLVVGVTHVGKVKVSAAAGVRLSFRPSADLRRQDLPPGADDDLAAVFAYTFADAARPGPWLELDARPAPNTVRVRPQHRLKWTPAGWRLESVIRVFPPARADLDQLTVELPVGWQGVEFAPADLLDPVSEPAAGGDVPRTLTLRFQVPQKAAFDLTLLATLPIQPQDRGVALVLPRFLTADERETRLTAAVPDGLELSGVGFGWEGGKPAAAGEPLKSSGRGSAAQTVTGEFDRGVSKVELGWKPFRPELGCEVRAEVTVQERQVAVVQVLKFMPTEGDTRPVLLRGPAGLLGLRSNPPLEPAGPDVWEYRPPEPGREFTLTVQFAARLPGGKEVPVPLLTAETATRADATVRVWGGGGRRADRFVGRWREVSPEPAADRDALPWFTLVGSAGEPLALGLPDPSTAAAEVLIERGLVQAVVVGDGTAAVRARFLLLRWPPAGVDVELPAGAVAEVYVDGKRCDPIVTGETVRVPAPDSRPGRSACLLDVRYQAPTRSVGRGGRAVVPPVVRGAAYRTAVRWTVGGGPGTVPLVPAAAVSPEAQWAWRGYGFGPTAVETATDQERWLTDGSDTAGPAAAEWAVVTQPAPRPVAVTPVPLLAWVAGCSFFGFAVALGVSRVRPRLVGLVAVCVAVVVTATGVVVPQPTAQFVAAAQPGVAVALVVSVGSVIVSRWPTRAERRRPTFRTDPPASPPAQSSTGSQSNRNGSPKAAGAPASAGGTT